MLAACSTTGRSAAGCGGDRTGTWQSSISACVRGTSGDLSVREGRERLCCGQPLRSVLQHCASRLGWGACGGLGLSRSQGSPQSHLTVVCLYLTVVCLWWLSGTYLWCFKIPAWFLPGSKPQRPQSSEETAGDRLCWFSPSLCLFRNSFLHKQVWLQDVSAHLPERGWHRAWDPSVPVLCGDERTQ